MRAFQFTPNQLTFLLVLMALMLSALPVAASSVPNSLGQDDFERGNYSGWYVGGQYMSAWMTSGNASTYGVALRQYAGGGARTWTSGGFYRTVDFSNIDTFQYTVRCTEYYDSWDAYYQVYIGGVNYGTYRYTHGWTTRTINTASITGNKTVEFRLSTNREYDDGAVIAIVLDDITVSPPIPPAPPEPDPQYIYFDKSTYNITNTAYIHYDRCYDHENLGWRWGGLLEPIYYAEDYLYLNVNAGDTYNDSWTNYRHVYGRKLSYTDLGNCWQSDNFLIASDLAGWRLDATLEKRTDLYAGVYGVYGRYLGTSVEVIDSDLALVIGSKPDNITEGDPVIDMPIVPDYESNYTPPQPQPGDNSTLGTSFLGGYYQTVDSIIGPIDSTGSGALYFVMSPVNTVSSSVSQVNGYATSTFDRVLFYVSPFGLFFTVIFDAIPDETEIIIMFSLVCGLILIVLRWK